MYFLQYTLYIGIFTVFLYIGIFFTISFYIGIFTVYPLYRYFDSIPYLLVFLWNTLYIGNFTVYPLYRSHWFTVHASNVHANSKRDYVKRFSLVESATQSVFICCCESLTVLHSRSASASHSHFAF